MLTFLIFGMILFMMIWSLADSIFQDALVPCRWMRDVTASLAQLTVTNDVTERELQHDVNETGDFDAGDINFDRCTVHPGQKRDVYCNNCQE